MPDPFEWNEEIVDRAYLKNSIRLGSVIRIDLIQRIVIVQKNVDLTVIGHCFRVDKSDDGEIELRVYRQVLGLLDLNDYSVFVHWFSPAHSW